MGGGNCICAYLRVHFIELQQSLALSCCISHGTKQDELAFPERNFPLWLAGWYGWVGGRKGGKEEDIHGCIAGFELK